MKKYPPVLWKEKPGAAKLLQQCEGAAKEWLAAAKAKGLWSDQNKQEFLRFSKGMRGDAAGLTKESGLWSLRDLGSDG